jgi:hypothetical protein
MASGDNAVAQWNAVASGVFSPAVTPSGDRGLSLFMRGGTGELLCRERNGAAWTETRSLGIPTARADDGGGTIPVEWPVSACSTGDGDIHLVARGPEGELVHGALRQGQWSGFELIGVPSIESGLVAVPMGLAAAPVACSRERGRMDVFAASAAGELVHAGWDQGGFTEFVSLGRIPARSGSPELPILGTLAACNCGDRRLAVLTRGLAGDLLVKWWDGAGWTAFESIGTPQEDDLYYPGNPRAIPLSGPPVACGGGSARLDAFARGAGGDLMHRSWDGAGWGEFSSLGMPLSPEPPGAVPFTAGSLACAWGKYRLDVFAAAADGKLYNLSWNGAPPGVSSRRP